MDNSWRISVLPVRSLAGLVLAANLGGPMIAAGAAHAQALRETGGRPQSTVLIRGTTGSGEQETGLFEEGFADDGELEAVGDATASRTVGIPTPSPLQVQGREQAVQREPQVPDPLTTASPGPRSNVRVAPSQTGAGVVSEPDPFAATGLRIGTWRVFSTLEQTLGYTTNTTATADGEGGGFSQTDAGISIQSDWSRHSARFDANGSWRRYLDGSVDDLPAANVSAGVALDLVDGVRATGDLTYDYSTEAPTSTNINSEATNRPGVHATGVTIGIARTDRRLVYSLRGSVGRTDYEAIELAGGSEESQDDRNNTLYTLSGRVGYQTSPAFTPFVEGQIGRRVHDQEKDRNGEERDSVIAGASVGVDVDISEKLTGEVSVGYQSERFEDGAIEDLDSWTLNGNLTWSPVRETTVNLSATTGFSGSTSAGQNGAIVNRFAINAERQVNDRLTLSADAAVDITRQDDGSRTDTVYTVGGGFNYWVNRFMALTGRVEHTDQRSTEGSAQEYDATVVRGGIRFQR